MTMNDLIRRKLTVEMSRQIPVSIPMMQDRQWYILGDLPPHYLVPTLLGTSAFYPECVVIYTPGYLDEVPGITWWNESYGLPLPDDHGQWNPN